MRIILSLWLLCFCTNTALATEWPAPPKGIRHYDTGIAEDFTLTDIDDNRISLSQFRGRWVFLHFWASWCGPCREEMPTINSLADRFDEQQLKIIMVNTAEDEDTIFSFVSEISMELAAYMDKDGLVTEHWKPRGLPTTFLIDPAGRVRYQAIGGRQWHRPLYQNFIQRLIDLQKL